MKLGTNWSTIISAAQGDVTQNIAMKGILNAKIKGLGVNTGNWHYEIIGALTTSNSDLVDFAISSFATKSMTLSPRMYRATGSNSGFTDVVVNGKLNYWVPVNWYEQDASGTKVIYSKDPNQGGVFIGSITNILYNIQEGETCALLVNAQNANGGDAGGGLLNASIILQKDYTVGNYNATVEKIRKQVVKGTNASNAIEYRWQYCSQIGANEAVLSNFTAKSYTQYQGADWVFDTIVHDLYGEYTVNGGVAVTPIINGTRIEKVEYTSACKFKITTEVESKEFDTELNKIGRTNCNSTHWAEISFDKNFVVFEDEDNQSYQYIKIFSFKQNSIDTIDIYSNTQVYAADLALIQLDNTTKHPGTYLELFVLEGNNSYSRSQALHTYRIDSNNLLNAAEIKATQNLLSIGAPTDPSYKSFNIEQYVLTFTGNGSLSQSVNLDFIIAL